MFACTAAHRVERPRHESARTSGPPRPAAGQLYAPDEALRDVVAGGPLQYVGTGSWPGIRRMYACAFRNARVLVVNVYCSPGDRQALRFTVYSPARGRVSIYAESKGAVSSKRRTDYFTFTVESEPRSPRVTPLTLGLPFDALRAYEEQRYNAFLPSCFGGRELTRTREGCLGELATQSGAWRARNGSFFEHANEDWYRLVADMRALSVRYGREPD